MSSVAFRIGETRDEVLRSALAKYKRIGVLGGPRAGKTTLAATVFDRLVINADDFIPDGWDAQPQAIIAACCNFDRYLVEGVHVARAIRKGLELDVALWLVADPARQTPKQRSMTKGIETIFESIRSALTIPVLVVS